MSWWIQTMRNVRKWWDFFSIYKQLILLIVYTVDRNSESESITNEDSSDNTIGPVPPNHNTTTAHDIGNNVSSNHKFSDLSKI